MWFEKFMAFANYTRKDRADHRYASIEKELLLLRQANQRSDSEASALKKKLSNIQAELQRSQQREEGLRWRSQVPCDLPALDAGCVSLYKRTLVAAQSFAPRVETLVEMSNAEQCGASASACALYWVVAYAGHVAHAATKSLKDEDGTSSEFVVGIRDAATKVSAFGATLELGVCQIYSNVAPAIKESCVGADMLIIVSGPSLVPGGGLRLFWVQAKRAEMYNAHAINIYRPPNTAGVTQFEALSRVHDPSSGSFAMYAAYSSDLPFVSAATVNAMAPLQSRDRRSCVISLADKGIRLQELVVGCSVGARDGLGQFASGKDVVDYLDNASKQAIVPLKVVSVHAGDDLTQRLSLASSVKALYDERLQRGRLTQQRNVPRLR